MKRRRLLALAASGSLVPITGCLGDSDSPDDADGSDPEAAVIEGQSCPPYATDRERAVCSHTVDRDAAAVYLDASPEVAVVDDGAPPEEVTLTLHNQSGSDLRFNPDSWRIRQYAGEEWTELDREWVGDGELTVPADGTNAWSFADAVEAVRPDPQLSPGSYAAEIGVPNPDADGEWIACVALVELEAPA